MNINNVSNVNNINIDNNKISKISPIEKTEVNISETEKKEFNNINKKINEQKEIPKYEINIDNLGFSYDSEAKEFIIKVERNNKIYQYPSEDLLKIRKYVQNNKEEHI